MFLVKDRLPFTGITAPEGEVAHFAADELRKYILKITGCELPISEDGGIILRVMDEDVRHDGFVIHVDGERLIISAKEERGLLYAVYALLEQFGCRWYALGCEFIPSYGDLFLENMNISESPDFAMRSLMEESSVDWILYGGDPRKSFGEIMEAIDWAAKNRLNTFDMLIHTHILGDIPFIGAIAAELSKRGMILASGGHCVQSFIDKTLFDEKPYLFVEKNGIRINKGNLCGAADELHSLLLQRARELLQKIPYLSVLHIWFEDSFEGNWCSCGDCRDLSPQRQQFNIVNRLALGLEKEFPYLLVDMLLYHDTLDMSKFHEDPAPNLVGMYAARERCYAHAIDDPACGRNAVFLRNLKKTVAKFDTFVFEYYADMILFTKMAVCMPAQIARDLRAYKQLGIGRVSCLCYLRYSRWAYPVNMYVYARAAWDAGFDFNSIQADFCAALYPDPQNAALMEQVFNILEDASSGILTVCGYKCDFSDLRFIPREPEDFHLKHMLRLREAALRLQDCAGRLKCASLRHESDIIQITAWEIQSILCQHDGDYDAAIDLKRRIIMLSEEVPLEIKGVSGSYSVFIRHLCNDQIDLLNAEKRNQTEN